MNQQVKLIHITLDCEKHVAYCARVSSPNQENPEFEGLLKYLIKHKHWSPFEMGSACLEITTSRAIAAQILRHRSFSFQEFSQRYSQATDFITFDARRQDIKNKQNSIDDMPEDTKKWFLMSQSVLNNNAKVIYNQAIERGIAKEQARVLLPLSTVTKLYMHGTIRSFIHWIDVRSDVSTQLEHRELAIAARNIFIKQIPTISNALGWTNNEQKVLDK